MPTAWAAVSRSSVERAVELPPAAERVVGPAGQCRGLEERERGGEPFVADPVARRGGGDGRARDGCGRGQHLGHVRGELLVADAGGCPVEPGDHRRAAGDEEVAPVELAVRDARVLQPRDQAPDAGEQRRVDGTGIEVEQRGAGGTLLDQDRDGPGVAGHHHRRALDPVVAGQ